MEETGSTLFESKELITTFAKFIYSYPGVDLGPIKTRAVLCHIYHHAIHDRWFQARDLMLMTHLQEGITHADVPTQVMCLLWMHPFFIPNSPLSIPHSPFSIPHSPFSIPHSSLSILHSAHSTPHSPLPTLHSAFCIPYSPN